MKTFRDMERKVLCASYNDTSNYDEVHKFPGLISAGNWIYFSVFEDFDNTILYWTMKKALNEKLI